MLVISILILFVGVAIAPSISGINFKSVTSKFENESSSQDCYPVSFFVFDKSGRINHEVFVSGDVVENISVLLEELKDSYASDPFSDDTISLQIGFIDLLDLYGLIPEGVSRDYLLSLVNPPWFRFLERILALTSYSPFLRGSVLDFLSNFFDVDSFDSVLPMQADSESKLVFMSNIGGVALGFLIPPYMLPRPRGFVAWSGSEGSTTYVGSMVQDESFLATGAQRALALGFIGFGISIYFGWLAFAFIGLAGVLYINAKSFIDVGPPNKAPVISNENPANGARDVPVSLDKLSFRISDFEGDRMSYVVTSNPDIGSGSGSFKKDGVYSVPVNGLQSHTSYSWHVVVSDDDNTVDKTFSFTTETVAPVVSDPLPVDGDGWVSVDVSELGFRLKDFQGDLMDYSVETSPDIGSGGGSGVGDGVYFVDVGGLDYTTVYSWFVNVTDGVYWTHEVFSFKTQPIMVFDPFDMGWQYRKKIIVDHDLVDGDLSGFPVLVSVVDGDLENKAQPDGDDVLFMDGPGVANRLFHEIELYDDSDGELVAWVKVSELDSNVDSVFYLYYGNPGCDSQEYPEMVWDSNYQAVWHFNEDDLGPRYDSTKNHNHGTPYNYDGDEGTSGIIDGADDFDGSNDHIRTGVSFDYNYRTVSFWFNANSIPPSTPSNVILTQDSYELNYGSFKAALREGNKLFLVAARDDPNFIYDVQTNTWYLIHLIRDGSQTKFYCNGDLIDTGVSGSGGSTSGPNKNLVIAASRHYDRKYDGKLDEIRISSSARSSSWIFTSYNNQNDPISFMSFGPEETGP
jgi:hypothetical protein